MKRTILIAAGAILMLCGCNGNQTQTAMQAQKEDTMDNPVIEAIMGRRSIRHYKDTAVDRETLMKIAECGINAPNAMNKQEWEVRIIDDEEFFNGATELMIEAMPYFVKPDEPGFRNGFRNATAAFAIACPGDDTGMLLQNVGLMSENICLAAYSLGLGTCVMGAPAMFLNSPEGKPYLDKLGFSDGYELQIIIACGYPDESPEAKPRDKSKIRFVE